MKKTFLTFKAIVIIILLFSSCTENEIEIIATCTGENESIEINRFLTKLETIHPGNITTTKNYEFSYDSYNLLEQVNESTFDYDIYRNYNYCSNNLVEVDNNYHFKYDTNNRLIEYHNINSYLNDYQLNYNTNKITVSGLINSKANTTIVLETNSNDLVIKINREDGYSTFDYDANGNLISAKEYNNSNALIANFEISYDTNPNPFYGQLQTSYLERFINYFSDSVILGIHNFFRLNQYNFPYLKNNPIKLKDINCTSCYDIILDRTYEYNEQNYPLKMNESYLGAPSVAYEYHYE